MDQLTQGRSRWDRPAGSALTLSRRRAFRHHDSIDDLEVGVGRGAVAHPLALARVQRAPELGAARRLSIALPGHAIVARDRVLRPWSSVCQARQKIREGGNRGEGRGVRTLGARRDRALRRVRSIESDLVPTVGGAAAPPQDLLPDERQRDLAERFLGQRAVRRRKPVEVAAAAAWTGGSADAHPVFTSALAVPRGQSQGGSGRGTRRTLTGWLRSSRRLRSSRPRTCR